MNSNGMDFKQFEKCTGKEEKSIHRLLLFFLIAVHFCPSTRLPSHFFYTHTTFLLITIPYHFLCHIMHIYIHISRWKRYFRVFFLMCFVGLRYVSINFIFFSSSVACKIVPFPFKIIFNEKNYPCSTKTDAERELNG